MIRFSEESLLELNRLLYDYLKEKPKFTLSFDTEMACSIYKEYKDLLDDPNLFQQCIK
jgi:hypothetical protein